MLLIPETNVDQNPTTRAYELFGVWVLVSSSRRIETNVYIDCSAKQNGQEDVKSIFYAWQYFRDREKVNENTRIWIVICQNNYKQVHSTQLNPNHEVFIPIPNNSFHWNYGHRLVYSHKNAAHISSPIISCFSVVYMIRFSITGLHSPIMCLRVVCIGNREGNTHRHTFESCTIFRSGKNTHIHNGRWRGSREAFGVLHRLAASLQYTVEYTVSFF